MSIEPVNSPYRGQMNPLHILPSFFFNIHLILSAHLRFHLLDGLFPSGFPTKLLYYAFHMPWCSNSWFYHHSNTLCGHKA